MVSEIKGCTVSALGGPPGAVEGRRVSSHNAGRERGLPGGQQQTRRVGGCPGQPELSSHGAQKGTGRGQRGWVPRIPGFGGGTRADETSRVDRVPALQGGVNYVKKVTVDLAGNGDPGQV